MVSDQLIVAGPASQALAVDIASYLHVPVVPSDSKVFPDGECYCRIDIENDSQLKQKDIIIVQTLGAGINVNQNQHIMELIMLISAAKRAGATKIRVVVPFLAYARQDKAFRPGEAVFVEELLRWIQAAGATHFYTVDVHAEPTLKVLTIPAFNIDPMEIFAHALRDRGIDTANLIVICPDKGAYERCRAFARYLDSHIPVVQFTKQRDVKTGEIQMQCDSTITFSGKTAVIADDIIATGGTMALAIKLARERGATQVFTIGTHPL